MRPARSGWRTSGAQRGANRRPCRRARASRHAGLPGEPAFPAAAERKLMPGFGGNGAVREVQRSVVQPVGCGEWWPEGKSRHGVGHHGGSRAAPICEGDRTEDPLNCVIRPGLRGRRYQCRTSRQRHRRWAIGSERANRAGRTPSPILGTTHQAHGSPYTGVGIARTMGVDRVAGGRRRRAAREHVGRPTDDRGTAARRPADG
jgi:hypothetical protein